VGCRAFADADFGGDTSAAFTGEGGGGGVCEGVGVPFLPPFLAVLLASVSVRVVFACVVVLHLLLSPFLVVGLDGIGCCGVRDGGRECLPGRREGEEGGREGGRTICGQM